MKKTTDLKIPTYDIERSLGAPDAIICGVDGGGAWPPLPARWLRLPSSLILEIFPHSLNDSKKLSAKKRALISKEITRHRRMRFR